MFRLLVSVTASVISSLVPITALAAGINHRDAVVEHLEGIMTASVQLEGKPAIQVQMTTCRVTVPDRDNSVFLYQEQALIGKLDRPYRQRFLEITADEDTDSNLVYSHSYKPTNQEEWVNYCRSTTKTVSRDDLGQLVCTVTLKPLLNIYSGKTQLGGCPAEVRGAVKITNQIILHQEGMDTWDRGFDASGNQVWGAEDRAYQFRRTPQ